MIRAIQITTSAILCSCIYGCVVATTNLVSSASIEISQASISKVGKLKIAGIVIIIRPANAIFTGMKQGIIIPTFTTERFDPKNYRFPSFYYKNSSLDTRDPFIVEILFSTGDHEAMFSPIGLMLQDEKGHKSNPVSFYSLRPRYSTTVGLNPVTPLCKLPDIHPGIQSMHIDYPSLSSYESKSSNPVHLAKDKLYCFEVKFDIPPVDPRSVFTIAVNDFNVDGQKISVPLITYAPDTYTEKLH
ncbi:hypothetical protein [Sulfuricaulis sp.]|uniref:hypothetical protein n=1 Tax=Sulfuricaulis sp. TaxID=2003553 RepID=UPI00355ACB5E